MAVRHLVTPIGIIRLTGTDEALQSAAVVQGGEDEEPEKLIRAARELEEYFSGTRREFSVRTAPQGTPFQRAVWAYLCSVPYGRHTCYSEVADMLGKPLAARAVGNAVGANPCLIFIPCHRVLAKNGIGGFSCGLWRKEYLMKLEGI